MGRMTRSSLFLVLLPLAWNVNSIAGSDELVALFSDKVENSMLEAEDMETPTRIKRSTTGFAYHGLLSQG